MLRKDIARRVKNVASARKTIDTSRDKIKKLEEDIAKKESVAEAMKSTLVEKIELRESWDEKVRKRERVIKTLERHISQYKRDKEKWEDAKIKVEQFLTFVGMCAYQDVDPVSGRRMRMLYQVPPTTTPLIAPSKVLSNLASKPSRRMQLAQASTDNYPVGSAGHETGCAYIDPQGGDYRGLADVDGHGRPCLVETGSPF